MKIVKWIWALWKLKFDNYDFKFTNFSPTLFFNPFLKGWQVAHCYESLFAMLCSNFYTFQLGLTKSYDFFKTKQIFSSSDFIRNFIGNYLTAIFWRATLQILGYKQSNTKSNEFQTGFNSIPKSPSMLWTELPTLVTSKMDENILFVYFTANFILIKSCPLKNGQFWNTKLITLQVCLVIT